MKTTITLAEMRARDVRLRADEVVTIAQQLMCGAVESTDAHPPFGPLTGDTVAIGADGRVYCFGSAATPSVTEVAILLQELLADHDSAVPGGLRSAMGRALLEVEAPPFDSLDDFSNILRRFERGDRTATIAALYARARRGDVPPHQAEPAPYVGIERRRCMPSPAELRRQLRETDRRLYEVSLSAPPAPVGGRGRRTGGAPFAAGVVACGALMAAGGWAYTTHATPAATQVASPQSDTQPVPLASTRFERARVPLPVDRPVTTMSGRAQSASPDMVRVRATTARHGRTTNPRMRTDTRIARAASQSDRRAANRSEQTRRDDSGVFPHFRVEWENPFKRTH